MKTNFRNGEVILLNKPLRWTSFAAVNKLKWAITNSPAWKTELELWNKEHALQYQKAVARNPKFKLPKLSLKIGHAGTLDPLATGLLIICTGKKTKEIENYQAQEKEYTGTICLGATTPCYDLEQAPNTFYETAHITHEMIYAATKQFTGKIFQAPPAHSAVMINGQRAYNLARNGSAPEMKEKEITIYEFEITAIQIPHVHFRVVCSKGTYIRSLANDFGKALNSGAYLAELCRTRIGNFLLKDALTVDECVQSLAVT